MPGTKTLSTKARKGSKMSPSEVLASAVASQRIEGLELDTQSIEDFKALEAGAVSASDLRKRLLARYSKTTISR